MSPTNYISWSNMREMHAECCFSEMHQNSQVIKLIIGDIIGFITCSDASLFIVRLKKKDLNSISIVIKINLQHSKYINVVLFELLQFNNYHIDGQFNYIRGLLLSSGICIVITEILSLTDNNSLTLKG